ncbi:MAG: UDP-3-O-(3-hydroxymyristoyl)glucosamine N-acyltransferase [Methyloligellaceae bacterium]
MEHPGFFRNVGPHTVGAIIDASGATPIGDSDLDMEISDVRTLDEARQGHITFIDNPKYLGQFGGTAASACFANPKFRQRAPNGTLILESPEPYRCFAKALSLFYPDAVRPVRIVGDGFQGRGHVHPSAVLEDDVHVEPGARIGSEVHIGRGTTIAAGATIGHRVFVGRDCFIGANVVVTHSLIGDRVIMHSGVSIGQDGYGFAMGPQGHLKVPQIGRVIIQDDVEIGANTAIDRGALKDTIIGEGTKIDNLVQIGHNVIIGRHCIITGQVGISGSTELADFVVIGGKAGFAGHLNIGTAAQIAAGSLVSSDVPPGARWGGYPAKPMRLFAREIALMKRLVGERRAKIRKDV